MSMELVLLLPILAIVFFGLIQYSILWSTKHHLSAVARTACRVATLSGTTLHEVEKTVDDALGREALIESRQLTIERGEHTGDPVLVELRVPMQAAAPDMLRALGITMGDHEIIASCVMRRE